jgi:tetratricopeptide (TPR) repeat protein
LALDYSGRTDAAIGVLRAEIEKHPFDGDALVALANCYEKIGDWKQAMLYASRVAQLDPANPDVQQLVQRLRTRLESPHHSSFSPAR